MNGLAPADLYRATLDALADLDKVAGTVGWLSRRVADLDPATLATDEMTDRDAETLLIGADRVLDAARVRLGASYRDVDDAAQALSHLKPAAMS